MDNLKGKISTSSISKMVHLFMVKHSFGKNSSKRVLISQTLRLNLHNPWVLLRLCQLQISKSSILRSFLLVLSKNNQMAKLWISIMINLILHLYKISDIHLSSLHFLQALISIRILQILSRTSILWTLLWVRLPHQL